MQSNNENTNFQTFSLSAPIQKALEELGYTSPTPIQAETLPILLGAPTDFLGLAATGTGKTAAFAIPLLERIEPNTSGVEALILCPTRELAIQVSGQINLLGKYKKLKALPIYGGAGYGDQIYGLKNGAKIVVGTPGRVVDHMNKGTLRLDKLKVLVLDEADEMISMGFKEDLELVLGSIPQNQANTWFFSATMGGDVRKVANTYLRDPQKVQMNRKEMLPETVEQTYFMVHEYDKPELVCKIIDSTDDFFGIIFCQTKSLVADLHQFLVTKGYKADCLHGDMDQKGRDRVMNSFRERRISILTATDVACRGLDVKDISHVINYSIPRELDNYVHRIGRTGRNGKSGLAISLVTNSHRNLIGRIEQMTQSRMKEGKIPTAKDVALRKVSNVQKTFEQVGPQGRVLELLSDSWRKSIETLSKEEIVSRFLSLIHPQLNNPIPAPTPAAPRAERNAHSHARTNTYKHKPSRPHSGPIPRPEQRRVHTLPSAHSRPRANQQGTTPWGAKKPQQKGRWNNRPSRPSRPPEQKKSSRVN